MSSSSSVPSYGRLMLMDFLGCLYMVDLAAHAVVAAVVLIELVVAVG